MRTPPPARLTRQRSNSDPYTYVPRRLLPDGHNRERRNSLSSFSTLVSEIPTPPDRVQEDALIKRYRDVAGIREELGGSEDDSDGGKKYDGIDEDEDEDQGKQSWWQRMRKRLRKNTELPALVSPPPSPGDPGLAYRHMFEGTEEERNEIIQDMRGQKPAHKSSSFWGRVFKGIKTETPPPFRVTKNISPPDIQLKFVLNLANALHIYNFPSHRIHNILAHVAEVLNFDAQFVHNARVIHVYYPKVFSSGGVGTRNTLSLVMPTKMSLDLGRIQDVHGIYNDVVNDHISAGKGSFLLMKVMVRKPTYSTRLDFALGWVQGFILCGVSFGGSLSDMAVSAALSFSVVIVQRLTRRTDLSKLGTDLWCAFYVSAIARALSSFVPNRLFCYQAISSAGVAGMLPGSAMLGGILDIANRQFELGSGKIVHSLLTSLMLGFGLTAGSDTFLNYAKSVTRGTAEVSDGTEHFLGALQWTNDSVPTTFPAWGIEGRFSFTQQSDVTTEKLIQNCYRIPGGPWYSQPLPWWSLFFLLPVINLVASLRRGVKLRSKEMPATIIISCASQAVTKVVAARVGLTGHPDYTALLGSFVVSFLGNLYAVVSSGTAFSVMLTGIWLLIPGGLAAAGGLTSQYVPGQDEYTQALELARKMISTIVGVMAGVYLSARILACLIRQKQHAAFFTF